MVCATELLPVTRTPDTRLFCRQPGKLEGAIAAVQKLLSIPDYRALAENFAYTCSAPSQSAIRKNRRLSGAEVIGDSTEPNRLPRESKLFVAEIFPASSACKVSHFAK